MKVKKGGANQASLNIDSGKSGRQMIETVIEVEGTLDWSGGDVSVAGAPGEVSRINVKPGGTFTFKSPAGWGENGNHALLSIQNEGLVEFTSSAPTSAAVLHANYTTTGITRLTAGGLLSVTGSFEQNPSPVPARLELLKDSTIITSVLGIRDGYFISTGSGMVTANWSWASIRTSPVTADPADHRSGWDGGSGPFTWCSLRHVQRADEDRHRRPGGPRPHRHRRRVGLLNPNPTSVREV